MSLTLKGRHPAPGEVDRRYYMMDVSVAPAPRFRASTGTRDKALASRREQAVYDALTRDPDTPRSALLMLARGEKAGAHIAARAIGNMTLDEAVTKAIHDPDVWGQLPDGGADYLMSFRVIYRILPAKTKVADITRERIRDLRDRLLEGRKPATVNRKLTALRRVLKACEEYIPSYQAPKFPKYMAEDGGRQFVLTFAQEDAIIAETRAYDTMPDPVEGRRRVRDGHDYADLFEVIADTGFRLSEALKIDWKKDVSFENRYIQMWSRHDRRTKNRSSRTIPMTDRVFRILMGRVDREVGPFHGMTKRRAQHHWTRARKACGIDDRECVIHSMRHTFATRMLERTGDLRLVQDMMGHKQIATTTIYAKVLTHRSRAGIDSMQAMRHEAEERAAELGDVKATFRDHNNSETATKGAVTSATAN